LLCFLWWLLLGIANAVYRWDEAELAAWFDEMKTSFLELNRSDEAKEFNEGMSALSKIIKRKEKKNNDTICQ
jgi:hypothetical protein